MMRCTNYAYDNKTLKAIVQCMIFAPTNNVWHDIGKFSVPFDFIFLLGLAISLSSQKKQSMLATIFVRRVSQESPNLHDAELLISGHK